MSNRSDSMKLWRQNTKLRAARCFNNECGICKYNKCIQALEFHHLISEDKDFSFSNYTKNPISWENLVAELRKCIMVCANCHREIHYGIVSIPTDIRVFNEDFVDYQIIEGTHYLCVCGKKLPKGHFSCSIECRSKKNRIIDWDIEGPIIKKMKDIDKMSFVNIADIYDTSDKTIAKWYYRQ